MFHLSPDEWTAVELSLRVSIVATAFALPFGIALGWLLARKDFWGKTLLDGIIYLPLVLPPVQLLTSCEVGRPFRDKSDYKLRSTSPARPYHPPLLRAPSAPR